MDSLTTVSLGDWATVSLGDWAIVSLGDWAIVSLGDWAILSLGDWATVSLGDWAIVSLGDWAIVYSGSWALAALWRYLCINSSLRRIVFFGNVFLIEAKIWSKTSVQVNPPSKTKVSSQRDKIHRNNQVRQRRQV